MSQIQENNLLYEIEKGIKLQNQEKNDIGRVRAQEVKIDDQAQAILK